MTMNSNSPIGIFDSGIGGLTVTAAIRRRLPSENIIYLGDTARVPYGTKSAETVIRYSGECAHFLLEKKVKAIVIACNTASAYALSILKAHLGVPVLGVVEPGARAALEVSKKRAIGVVGTSGTIASNAYGKALKSLDGDVRVVSRACPLLVPLVEEGWIDNEVTRAAVSRYLNDMKGEGIDALVLGCTHYPMIADTIREQIGEGVTLIDSAETTAAALEALLERSESKAATGEGVCRLYFTDLPPSAESIASRFLGEEVQSITRVDL